MSTIGVLALSCSADPIRVPLPSLGDAVSLLVATISPAATSVRVVDVKTGLSSALSIDVGSEVAAEDVRVELARLSCPIDDLGLTDVGTCGSGCFELRRASSGTPLPSWTKGSRYASSTGWQDVPAGELFEDLDYRFEIDSERLCSRFSMTSLELGPSGVATPTFLTHSPEGGVLLGMRDGRFFELQGDRLVEYTRLSSTAVGRLVPDRGACERDGAIFLVGGEGEAAKLLPSGEMGMLPSLRGSPATSYAWLAPSPSGQPFEIFVLTAEGYFQVLDGASWLPIRGAGQTGELLDHGFGGLAWIGVDSALAIVAGSEREQRVLLHYDEGVELVDELPKAEPSVSIFVKDDASAVAYSPAFGALVGTRYGRLYRHGPLHQFDTLAERTGSRVRFVAPVGESVYFGGSNGVISEYSRWFGLCPSVHTSRESVNVALHAAGRMVLLLRPDREEINRLEILTPLQPKSPCFSVVD
ncbi:MAG: hypothetical protein HY791_35280 [Deltaproteobacteria bacterium]|nr:hypothetical protein [Deltaproteobacteria bacterium]